MYMDRNFLGLAIQKHSIAQQIDPHLSSSSFVRTSKVSTPSTLDNDVMCSRKDP